MARTSTAFTEEEIWSLEIDRRDFHRTAVIFGSAAVAILILIIIGIFFVNSTKHLGYSNMYLTVVSLTVVAIMAFGMLAGASIRDYTRFMWACFPREKPFVARTFESLVKLLRRVAQRSALTIDVPSNEELPG
jgi:hypothetical protein